MFDLIISVAILFFVLLFLVFVSVYVIVLRNRRKRKLDNNFYLSSELSQTISNKNNKNVK